MNHDRITDNAPGVRQPRTRDSRKWAPRWSPPWTFSGPLELVAVGARRAGRDVDIDCAGLRSAKISADALSGAVSDYTETHVTLDSDLVPDQLASPGDFRDDLPGDLKRDLINRIGLIRLLFHNG
ncbi:MULTISPECIES: hypothetical protein [Streptomyces]|uniref:hypothetical protein n=1 Tax=Streptomyces TaxID=1883 RepID=UPI00287FB0C7|nr:hypothetical protein [Streptomyces sp. CGMCC 4.1456]WNF67241.1 hypothetical protein RJD14_33835 [Streptomyces sp. CGMCC 4.1456]